MFERIVVVEKRTAFDELLARHYSFEQANFFLEQRGEKIAPYKCVHDVYHNSLAVVKDSLPQDITSVYIERDQLSNFLFRKTDFVIAVGSSGLFVNIAKYLIDEQPILAVNAEGKGTKSMLMSYNPNDVQGIVRKALDKGEVDTKNIVLAQANTNDGQSLLAVNDFLIGRRDQISARYSIQYDGMSENQSSSGVLVSTGLGSNGWMKSILHMASVLSESNMQHRSPSWDEHRLIFAVREAFPSYKTGASIVYGNIDSHQPLSLSSHMPEGGVIFSDGIPDDAITFTTGTTVEVSVAQRAVKLII